MKYFLFLSFLFLFINQIFSQTIDKNWNVALPHGCDSTLHVNEPLMKDKIVKFMGIDSVSLDFSIESLLFLDEGLNALGFKKNSQFTGIELSKEEDFLFSAIVFYFGETLRRYVKGQWHYEQIQGHDIYIPYVVTLDGDEVDFYGYIEEYFFRNDNGRMLLPTMESLLLHRKNFIKVEKWENWIFPRLDEKKGE